MLSKPISLILEGRILPEQHWTYLYLPFTVPTDIARIDVSYFYDAVIGSDPQLAGGNTIDIGIFDPQGYSPHSQGYRGWTGSARKSFFIALDDATPGYMPGPIQPGTWNIILGVYKVADDGCHFQVDITLTPESTSKVDFPTLLHVSDIPGKRIRADGWYKGELHCHTLHSDGDSEPEEIVKLAESLDLDFLSVTDHNNRSQQISLATCNTDLILIPGYEVTTFYGHWNIWGDNGWIDFRVQSPEDLATYIAQANVDGFLVSCNHPRQFGPEWAFPQVEGFQCVEVWNGPWQFLNTECLAFWEAKLRQGKHLTAVGGSDHHFSHRQHIAHIGQPATYIYSAEPPSCAALLKSLRAGHVFITESPTGPKLELRSGNCMMGDTIPRPENAIIHVVVMISGGKESYVRLMGNNGLLAQTKVSTDNEVLNFSVNTISTLYVRAEVIDKDKNVVRALTNPIYIAGV